MGEIADGMGEHWGGLLSEGMGYVEVEIKEKEKIVKVLVSGGPKDKILTCPSCKAQFQFQQAIFGPSALNPREITCSCKRCGALIETLRRFS